MTEADIQAAIMLNLGRGETRIFRNHVARGFTGEVFKSDSQYTIIKNARRASFGLCVGSSDCIGFRKLIVTPEMVGTTLAVFTAIEVKSATGRPTPEQVAFIRVIQQAGGFAGIARSVAEARAIVGLPV
jgi:hypothetical protein